MSEETKSEQPIKAENDNKGNPANDGPKKRKVMIILAIIIFATLLLLGKWWINSKTHIETDNAFVEARVVSISSKVPGTVKRVLVIDNQFVKRGELLVELDEKDYQVKVANATAGVGLAENETGGELQKAEGARATVQLAKARDEQAGLDLKRGTALFSREVIPKEQLDRIKTAKRVTESQLKEAQEALKRAMAEAGLAGKGGNKARIMQRKSQLEEASLQLSYTRIVAPVDGYITRKGVEAGANMQAGQPMLALVPLQEAWVTANYKEAQLTHIKQGQKVEFTVDAYPGKKFSGHVDSIMAGTGAAFSMLPPENATGNYVKVVQRIPVKIAIDNNSDPEHLLRVGMSVIPTVLVNRSAMDVIKDLF